MIMNLQTPNTHRYGENNTHANINTGTVCEQNVKFAKKTSFKHL